MKIQYTSPVKRWRRESGSTKSIYGLKAGDYVQFFTYGGPLIESGRIVEIYRIREGYYQKYGFGIKVAGNYIPMDQIDTITVFKSRHELVNHIKKVQETIDKHGQQLK